MHVNDYIGLHLTNLSAGIYYIYISEYSVEYPFEFEYLIGTEEEPTQYATGNETTPNLSVLDYSSLEEAITTVKEAYNTLDTYKEETASPFKTVYEQAVEELANPTFLKLSEIRELSGTLLSAWKVLESKPEPKPEEDKKIEVPDPKLTPTQKASPATADNTNIVYACSGLLISMFVLGKYYHKKKS